MSDVRGVPIVSRGSSSTMPGTNPLQALLAKETREERRQARSVERVERENRQARFLKDSS